MTGSAAPFYPADAAVPDGFRTDRVAVRPLRAADAELDHEAVVSSAAMLRRWSQTSWPADDFTVEENRADLARHEREHAARVAFTYTVMTPDGTRCLGCIYLEPAGEEGRRALGLLGPHAGGAERDPLPRPAHVARVGFWVRASEVAHELDRHLLAALRPWLATAWAFDAVAFTASPEETRQVGLLADGGLVCVGTFALAGGRTAWLFREAHVAP